MTETHLLTQTPFLATGDLATVAPAWARELTALDDADTAARRWLEDQHGPVVGPRHEVDGVSMVEVSFVDWDDDLAAEHYALVGALQGKRPGDLAPFVMHRVGTTGLRHTTLLLPADGCYSYVFTRPDPHDLEQAEGHGRLVTLFASRRLDERNPARLPANGVSVWQGPDFPAHRVVSDPAPAPAEDLSHVVVTHADGRQRDVWLHRATSGTARTVVLFDGDSWRELGVGAELWGSAGYDANLLLMSSMEAADRTPDLTEPDRAASTLHDVLEAASQAWGVPLAGEDVILVGQSFGGLAVVSTVLQHPDVAAAGVCMSGSFFFVPGQPLPQDLEQVGAHRQALRSLQVPERARLVMLSGRDEPIAGQSLAYLDEAQQAGVDVVSFRHLRGTHDYAWWRHAIFHGLDELLAQPSGAGGGRHTA